MMDQRLLQLVQLVKGRNPEQFVMSMLNNNQISDPNIKQMIKFAQTGDTNQLVNLASSMMAQKGLNLDQEFSSFMSLLK